MDAFNRRWRPLRSRHGVEHDARGLDYSLQFISSLGVDRIQAHRRPLLDLEKLRQELPRLGFEPITPVESTSPIVTFAKQDTSKDGAEVEGTNIDIAVYPHRIRISPSVYNDMADGNRLLEAIT